MENQHRQIAGYRELDASEIALMNRIKARERDVAELVQLVRNTSPAGEPQRQAALAVTAFEDGFMRLVRAVAQPASPWVRHAAPPAPPPIVQPAPPPAAPAQPMLSAQPPAPETPA